MRILQLGNGGGLNPMMTNSSFLIELQKNSYLLFDCGFNIMQRLIELEETDDNFKIENIKYIFLSHTHDDHVGNVETLIYWNYFKNNKIMTIFTNDDTSKYLEKISNAILAGGSLKYINLFNERNLSIGMEYKIDGINILPCLGYHGSTYSTGLLLEDRVYNNAFFISGDTKAHEDIEEFIYGNLNMDRYPNNDGILIFHDFSYWNAPSKNVHACESDFESEYSEKFKKLIIKYHTGDEKFNKEWQDGYEKKN